MAPSISVIVPVCQVESYIEACIRSVLSQTYEGEIECIVVDDCGKDGSMLVVNNLVLKYDGPVILKTIHHSMNRGLSAARNTGIEAATGAYILFLDGDDELTSDCLEKLAEPLKREEYDWVLGSFSRIDDQGNEIPQTNKQVIPTKAIKDPDELLKVYEKTSWLVTAWNKLYRTAFIRQHNLRFKEGIIHEDVCWGFQVACLAKSSYLVGQNTYRYRIRQDSIMTAADKLSHAKSYAANVIEMEKFVNESGIYNQTIHDLIQKYFFYPLNYNLRKPREFLGFYREMRQNAPSCKQYAKNWRDIHYFIPTMIAPYAEWVIAYWLSYARRKQWGSH